MSDSKNYPQHLLSFVWEPLNDPAKIDFIPKLKDHLLGRLLNKEYDGDDVKYSNDQKNSVRIIGDRIYSSKVLRINYTTYDMRRDQDTMNPRTHCDVMVLSAETEPGAHPFWYAWVLGVFHTKVLHTGPDARNHSIQHMEFLWVRWFGIEQNYAYGSRSARLPKIGFVPTKTEPDPDIKDNAFGFLDPSLVLHGCHLVPAFEDGRTGELLQTTLPTAARLPGEVDDWANYYVMIWVDRDMFMRHLGGGIGHVNHHSRWGLHDNDSDKGMDISSDNTDKEEVDTGDIIGVSTEPTEQLQTGSEPRGGVGDSDSDLDSDSDATSASDSDSDIDVLMSTDEDDIGPKDGEVDDGSDDNNSLAGDGYASF